MLRYFLSGATGVRGDVIPDIAALIECRLLSMHDVFKGNTKTWVAASHHPKSAMREVMLDSGAFTAFMHGKQVNLDTLIAAYEDTIRKLSKSVKQIWLINLDVIAGEQGRVSTPAEMSKALADSDRNFKVLRKRFGDRVLPVYHQTEPMSRLKEVVAQAPFVAMGFRQDLSEEFRIRVAEEALQYAHSKGALVHGLATTGYRMLRRAPFDSVDSATWLYAAAMGKVMFLNETGRDLLTIDISTRSPQQREHRGHYRTLPKQEQALIDLRMREAGVTLAQCEADLSYRTLLNAHQIREWLRIYQRPAITAEKGLFSL